MRISLFTHAKDRAVVPWEGPWETFSEEFEAHDFSLTEKLSVPAFSPAEYPDGATRGNKSVKQLWLFVLDVDGVDDDKALEIIEGIQKRGLASLIYSTWSHAKKPNSFRAIIPLSEPVPAKEWPGFWMRANSLFGGVCDPQCKDPSRIFFAAYAPAGTEDEAFMERYDGHPLDVVAVREIPLEEVEVPSTDLDKLSVDKLRRHAKRLTRRKDDRSIDLGETLLKVCEGDAFASPGNRDNTIFHLACDLGERFVNYTPESIAAQFGASLAMMRKQSPDCPTIHDVAYKIARRQEEIRKEQQAEKENELAVKNIRIQEAFLSSRTEPYTDEEIKSFGPRIKKRLIIQKNASYYIFVDGTYRGPYSDKELLNAVECDLAPAVSMGVELTYTNYRGQIVKKTPQQLVSEYGKVAQKLHVDLRAQHTTFDESSSTLIEATCPLKPIEPKFHEEIDKWYRTLAGDQYDLLCRWIAWSTKLDKPCVALFITGAKNVGKSLFALGHARQWTTNGPTMLEDCFGNFNDALANCPLTFADEQLPKDSKGHAKSAELRYHIQALSRPLKRKFVSQSTMHGATRTIVAANNMNVLATNETLTQDDIAAVAERYLHIHANPEAADYLQSVDTSGWVDRDMIAEHALWLRDNHKMRPEGRFLIQDPKDTLATFLSVQVRGSSMIAEWLINYLTHPEVFHADARSKMLVRIYKGRLLVNVKGIVKCWGLYQDERRPSTNFLVKDIRSLCAKDAVRLKNSEARAGVTNYYEIRIEMLQKWNEGSGFVTAEDIAKSLEKDSEEIKKSLPKGKGKKDENQSAP